MNSKQLACIFLALYVVALVLAFSLVKFAMQTETEKKPDDLVYVALEMPKPEIKKEKKIKEQPKSKRKRDQKHKNKGANTNASTNKKDNQSSDPNKNNEDAQEAKGKEEKTQTIDDKALLTSYIKGNSAPIAQGNAGEVSDKTEGSSNYHDGFDSYGITVSGAEGGDPSRKLRGEYLPQPDPKRVKQTGELYLKLKVDKNGKVISVSVDKRKSNISDPTTINAIVEAIKTRAKYDAGESEMMVEVKYVCKQKS